MAPEGGGQALGQRHRGTVMARMRVLIVFIIAITAGGALALGTYNYTQKIPPKTVTMATKSVVVATGDLEIGAELTKDDVRVGGGRGGGGPRGPSPNATAVVARALFQPLAQYEPILPMKL